MLPQAGLAKRLGLPVAATHPVYCVYPEQAPLLRTLAAIRLNRTLADLPSEAVPSRGSYLIPPVEFSRRFESIPIAIEGSRDIAARCQIELPLGRTNYPKVPLPEGFSASQALRQKAENGARRLYGMITPAIRERLDHELEVIQGRGYEPIFLIVEELLNFAHQQSIPYSSRGSAASSLVAHCLGITSPDPLALDLYFERFLNPARTTPPDIDTDLCSRRRAEVIQHVFDTYGSNRVAMVGTINRFRPRSALGEAAKAHGLAPVAVRQLVETLPYGFFARMEESRAGGEEGEPSPPSPFSDLAAGYPQHRALFNEAEALLKLPRHLSVHAGGLVVAPGELTDLAPVMRSGSKGVIITQFDLESVEALGLVKIDLLGIRGLTVLGDVETYISAAQEQPSAGASQVSPESTYPDISEDSQVSDRIEAGQTIGCFQIESPGMRSTLREIRARTVDDLMAALALYRPGPLTGGLKDAFVRRFKGEEAVIHLHPALTTLLADTYGVILYQEQVLRIAHQLAGFTLAEADLLRRAMSHFDPGKQMIALRQKFITGAQARSGVPVETGERVWELMAAFSGYGFPKAHAASYAQVSWHSAWCKTYFPAQFMAAVLANWGGYYSQRVYLGEARRQGLAVRPPHVNYSRAQFTAVPQFIPPGGGTDPAYVLYAGLDQVKELTRRTIEKILRLRPFISLEDFLLQVNPRRQEAESLARVGAFDDLSTIPAALERIARGGPAGQLSLFESPSLAEDWTLMERAVAQEELLGLAMEVYPLELVAGQIAAAGAVTTLEAASRLGSRLTVAGMRLAGHRSRTAKGEAMMFLTLEDLEGMLDVVVFPDAYRRSKAALSGSQPLLVTGVIEMDPARGEPLMKAEFVERMETNSSPGSRFLRP
jgi:DNA polymerase III subunit alpha